MTDQQKRTKRLAQATGAGLVGVVAAGSLVGSHWAAEDLAPQAQDVLAEAGLAGVNVDFDGREAELSGGTPAELAQAEKLVEGIEGVRWANVIADDADSDAGSDDGAGDGDGTNAGASAPSLSIAQGVDGLTVSGSVATAEAAADIESAAIKAFGADAQIDLTVDPAVSDADWVGNVPDLFGSVSAVDDLSLDIDAESVSVGGKLGEGADVDAISASLQAAAGDLKLTNGLTEPDGADGTTDPAGLNAADAATVSDTKVYFQGDVDAFAPNAASELKRLAAILKDNPSVTIVAQGHSGPGVESFVRKLAQSRVDAVKAYLVKQGVDAAQISTKNFGASRTKIVGDPENRRVDFIVKGN